jgi:Mrp family chromosome partitioning ATPase
VILVLEAENTRGSIAAANKEKIEKAGGRVLGVVLNKRRNHIPKTLQKLF